MVGKLGVYIETFCVCGHEKLEHGIEVIEDFSVSGWWEGCTIFDCDCEGFRLGEPT